MVDEAVKKKKKTSSVTEDKRVEKVPAKLDSLGSKAAVLLNELQEKIDYLIERQEKNVSPEFSALMDGYVNKANEGEKYKVQCENMATKYDEQITEMKVMKEATSQLVSDLDAAKDALRSSESDLHHLKKEFNQHKQDSEEKISDLADLKSELKDKIKHLEEIKDKDTKAIDALKTELLESNHKVKHIEQEKQAEIEKLQRSLREQEKISNEVKEQLDLRIREVEYKDALLNQLIRDAAIDNAYNPEPIETTYQQPKTNQFTSVAEPMPSQAINRSNELAAKPSNSIEIRDSGEEENHEEPSQTQQYHPVTNNANKASKEAPQYSQPGSMWGAFNN